MLKIEHLGIAVKNIAESNLLFEKLLNTSSYKMEEVKSIEVGNIFNLGTRFTDALELCYTDEKNQKQSVWMGSYGIGIGRVLGTIAEIFADDKGLVWPKQIAPFQIVVIPLQEDEEVKEESEKIYQSLIKNNMSVLLFDTKAFILLKSLPEIKDFFVQTKISLNLLSC